MLLMLALRDVMRLLEAQGQRQTEQMMMRRNQLVQVESR